MKGRHNHPEEWEEIIRKQMVAKLKKASAKTSVPLMQVYSQQMKLLESQTNDYELAEKVSFSSVKSSLYNARKHNQPTNFCDGDDDDVEIIDDSSNECDEQTCKGYKPLVCICMKPVCV